LGGNLPNLFESGLRRRIFAACLCCGVAACFTAAQAAPNDNGCREELTASWSETETTVWQSLARGEEIDLRGLPPNRRLIEPRFFQNILSCEELSDALPRGGIALKGAIVPGILDFSLMDVPVRISCTFCFLDQVNGRESQWRHSLVLDDSKLHRGLNLALARFDDEFRAQRLVSDGDLRLDQISVGRNVVLFGLNSPQCSMRDGRIGGKLRLDGAIVENLDLGGTQVGNQLILSGIKIAKRAVLDRMKIGGDLLLRTYEGGPDPIIGASIPEVGGQDPARSDDYVVVLNSTKIGGRLEIAHARINGPVSLDAIRVEEDIWLRDDSEVRGNIQMPFSRIGQNFDLSTSLLQSIDATGSTIGGELRLGAASLERLSAPRWQPNGRFVLRNASAAAWVDFADCLDSPAGKCPAASDAGSAPNPWPPSIDVIGFSYDRAGGLGGGIERPEEWYVDWVNRQEPFSLDPYRRLADYLLTNGRVAAANQVLYAGKQRQRQQSDFFTQIVLLLQWIFVGYGIRTWYILFWVVGIIILGALIFSRTPEAKARHMPFCLAFSTETFLPFVALRKQHGEIDFSGGTRYYLYFHKLMGWVCSLFFVSALAGLFEV
jgi:hypothetical protein